MGLDLSKALLIHRETFDELDKEWGLDKQDKYGATYVEVTQARMKDVEQLRAYLMSASAEQFDYNKMMRLQVYVSLSGSNMRIGEQPAFKFENGRLDMTEEEFAEVWALIPQEYATAIHKATFKVNRTWDNPYDQPDEKEGVKPVVKGEE